MQLVVITQEAGESEENLHGWMEAAQHNLSNRSARTWVLTPDVNTYAGEI